MTLPSAKPTLDAYVKKATSYLSLARDCSDLFGLDGQMLRRRGEDTIKQGHAEFGGDAFGRLLVMEVDVVKEDMRQNGFVGFGLNALKRVQAADGPLVSSPSFDCARAGTPTEHAICDNPDLIARDRAMGILYRVLSTIGKAPPNPSSGPCSAMEQSPKFLRQRPTVPHLRL